jgi:hypothetical protein
MLRNVLVGVVSVIGLVACGGGGSGPTPLPVIPTYFKISTCAPSGPTSSTNPYVLTNEIWAAVAPSTVPPGFSQCVVGSADTNSATLTSTWTSGIPTNAPLSYGSVAFGHVPGYPSSGTSRLPALVSALPTLLTQGTVASTCAPFLTYPCKYATAFDLQFVTSLGAKSTVLEIFTDYQNQDISVGGVGNSFGYVGDVTLGGHGYHVLNSAAVVSGGATVKYLAYVAISTISALDLDLSQFVSDALTRPYPLSPVEFLSSVELGTQVISGTGRTDIVGYALR